ncbi:MAG: hypothetical protein ACTHON_08840, partial [Humibacter sp.]
ASILAKAVPFGVGAVVGGVGNRITGSRVVHAANLMFGSLPATFPESLTLAEPQGSSEAGSEPETSR